MRCTPAAELAHLARPIAAPLIGLHAVPLWLSKEQEPAAGRDRLAQDVERVAAARSALGPSARIRLDANGAWSGDEALAILTDVERYGIEYVEQPVPADDLESLASLRRRAKVRIAADEAVADESSAIALLDAEAADVLILKPPTLGGVRATAAIAKRACFLSSSALLLETYGS